MRGFRRSLVFAVITLSLASTCAGGTGGGGGGSGPLTKVRLQLQWVAQSQFAGYYAAAAKGYYKDAGLEVEIKLGGPDIVPQQVVASDGAEFGIAWVPKMLASREAGADLVNIAQVFQRSGTLEVSFKEKNITAPEQWKGKKSGNEDIATRFLQASFKGWVFCRDSQKECVDIVLKAGTTLGKGHMTWQLNEINALIWPSPSGIGAIEKASWDQTVSISTTYQ